MVNQQVNFIYYIILNKNQVLKHFCSIYIYIYIANDDPYRLSEAYQQTNNNHYCYDIGHFIILLKTGKVRLDLEEGITKGFLHNRYLQYGKKRWLKIFIPILLMANSDNWTFKKQDMGIYK